MRKQNSVIPLHATCVGFRHQCRVGNDSIRRPFTELALTNGSEGNAERAVSVWPRAEKQANVQRCLQLLSATAPASVRVCSHAGPLANAFTISSREDFRLRGHDDTAAVRW